MTDTPPPAFGARLVKDIEHRELKQARAIMIGLGLLTLVTQWLVHGDLAKQEDLVRAYGEPAIIAKFEHLLLLTKVGIGVGVAYLVLAALVFRKPVMATTAGLVLYLGALTAQLVIAPGMIFGDIFAIGIRAIVLLGLVGAVRFARLYEQNRQRTQLPKAKVL
jgi:hypothetical protein